MQSARSGLLGNHWCAGPGISRGPALSQSCTRTVRGSLWSGVGFLVSCGGGGSTATLKGGEPFLEVRWRDWASPQRERNSKTLCPVTVPGPHSLPLGAEVHVKRHMAHSPPDARQHPQNTWTGIYPSPCPLHRTLAPTSCTLTHVSRSPGDVNISLSLLL